VKKFIKNNWIYILCALYWTIFATSFVFPSFKKTPLYTISMTSIVAVQVGYLGKMAYRRWRKKYPTKKTIALNLLADKPTPNGVWHSFDGKMIKIYDNEGRIGTVSLQLNKKRNKLYIYYAGALHLIKTEHKGFDELIYWANGGIKIHSFEKHNQKCAQWKSWFVDGRLQQEGWMNKAGDCMSSPGSSPDKMVNTLIFKDGYALGPDMKYYPDEDLGYDTF